MSRKMNPKRLREILLRAYGIETPTLNYYFSGVIVPAIIKERITIANRKLGRTNKWSR
jgi:hypothetical protein